nr:immunoglobulin heavy chain junction region [Mus musculus]
CARGGDYTMDYW